MAKLKAAAMKPGYDGRRSLRITTEDSMGRIITKRLVQDPSMTDAEYWHQINRENERAERKGRKADREIGKIEVEENAITRLGALVYIRRREAHHEMAAERFKSLYEHMYGCGNPALDPSRVQVDTSPIAHDAGMAGKIDRGRDLASAISRLGKPASDRLIALLVLCIPAGDGLHWRMRTLAVNQVLEDLDALCLIWGQAARGA